MTSWIHLFSNFTPELLLFELFGIFALMALYSAFWVLKKRRLGVIDDAVPSGMVRIYLNELIQQAHLIRTQLFGLLGDTSGGAALNLTLGSHSSGPSLAQTVGVVSAGGTAGADPNLNAHLQTLEGQLAQQKLALEKLENEKRKIAEDLEAARKSGGNTGASTTGSDDPALKKKIKELEDKLAEYSVIEDDLANLKRLQQENAQLRATLEGKGIAAPAPAATSAVATSAAQPASETPEATPPSAPAAAATEAPAASDAGSFDGLANNVTESLQAATAAEPTPAPETPTAAEPAAPAANAAPATSATVNEPQPAAAATPNASPQTEAKTEGKSDEDLLSEFEKMLNMP